MQLSERRADERRDHPITRPLADCPVCRSSRLDPVVETERETVHFLCRDCLRCWHVELGFVHLMTPTTCLGIQASPEQQ
jgi:hypothetical protein